MGQTASNLGNKLVLITPDGDIEWVLIVNKEDYNPFLYLVSPGCQLIEKKVRPQEHEVFI